MDYERFLVTGGAGFIGSHLVDRLLQLGKSVYVLDDFSTGTKRNLAAHLANKKLRVIKGSVSDSSLVRDIVGKVQCIFHHAAQVSVPKSMRDPFTTDRINIEGTLALLWACLKRKKTRFVYASSCSVYGDIGDAAAREDMAPRPLSPYSVSKLCGELFVSSFARTDGLPTVSLRYFNVFGPRQRSSIYGGVVSIFVRRVRNVLPPIIYGDGNQTRDFIHVSDVVEANLRAATLEAPGEVINVATGNSLCINDLARMVAAELGKSQLAPIHASPRLGDIKNSRADIAKQRSLLKLEPRTSVQEGIRSMIAADH